MSIKAIDKGSIHYITSGQVVIDLQTAVKELVENSVDAGATNIEVRFKNHGLSTIEVIDNGCGIAEEDHESIALKHHTFKLETYSDLTSVETFGFRGEALSSLCALSEQVSITTATATTAPMGVTLVMDSSGKIIKRSTVARNQGTSITLTNVFTPLAVRRKELERNIKREYGKALSLLHAYALGPCAAEPGVRLTVSNQQEKGSKSVQIKTLGSPSCRASVTALWGPKSLENIVDMDITFEVEREKIALKRLQNQDLKPFSVQVKGLISKFSVGCGRTGTDRQFFYVNGRPCNMNKVQKGFNEVYRSFNATQAPFIVADFILPTQQYDVNVSPDKRTILLHSEANLVIALKAALEAHFQPTRATFDLGKIQTKPLTQSLLQVSSSSRVREPTVLQDDEDVPDAFQPSEATSPELVPSPEKVDYSERTSANSQDSPMDSVNDVPTVTLDTSQTSWGQRMALPSPSQRPSRLPSLSPPPAEREDEDESPTKQHPRKKRKSDMGVIPIRASLGPSPSAPTDRTASESGERARSAVVPVVRAMTLTKTLGKRGSKEIHTKNSREKCRLLQSQLAGFSRPGSQAISQRKSLDVTPVTEDEEGLSEDEDGQEDELIEDEPPSRPADSLVSPDGRSTPPLRPGGDEDSDEIQDITSTMRPASDIGSSTHSATFVPRTEILKRGEEFGDVSLRFDIKRTKAVWSQRSAQRKAPPKPGHSDAEESLPSVPADAGVTNTDDTDRAASALSRVIEKKDFAEMDVVGQFNLGFIIVHRLDRKGVEAQKMSTADGTDGSDDLFIVDQHAADEKYNFETLQATTKIESQKLFRPRPLELTAADEMIAIENINILQQNGFEIDICQETDTSAGNCLKLTAQPVSKSTTFDMKDLEEVIHLLRDRPGAQMVRCSKARSMFAMRACRKSVMVGMPLTQHQMTTVVRHMGTMDQPWNCPHGRPTMRHLIDIRSRGSQRKDDIAWSSFE